MSAEFDITKLYSTNELTRKTIKACGMEFDVFVRRLPAVDLRRFHFENQAEDMDARATAGFRTLVKSIRDESGKPFATFEQYQKMEASAIAKLLGAFLDVNTPKDDDDLGKG